MILCNGFYSGGKGEDRLKFIVLTTFPDDTTSAPAAEMKVELGFEVEGFDDNGVVESVPLISEEGVDNNQSLRPAFLINCRMPNFIR